MVMLAAERYASLAELYGLSPTEMAIAWANQRQCNGSVIIGTTSVAQVRECVGAFKIELPQALMDAIDDVHEVRRVRRAGRVGRTHRPYAQAGSVQAA